MKEDQPLVEVMTDKATVEIPSPVEGTVEKCVGEEGEIVDVGSILLTISETPGQELPAQVSSAGEAGEAVGAQLVVRLAASKVVYDGDIMALA